MEKNLVHPTDARLYEKARRQLVALAVEGGIDLRQNCNRLAPPMAIKVGRDAHAKQVRRIRKALKKRKGYRGRVLRRQLQDIPEAAFQQRVLDQLWRVDHRLQQTPKSPCKIYALHEPEVDCVSKGKARMRSEFGTKVSSATTIAEGFVVGLRALSGNPYDGHTLAEALEQVSILTERKPTLAGVDRSYRGHGLEATGVLIRGTRRGMTPPLAKRLTPQRH